MEPIKDPWPSSSHDIRPASLHRTQSPSMLKARTRKKKFFPWQPLGVENPGPNNRTAFVTPWQQQYEWLNARYKYLHDRETVAARRNAADRLSRAAKTMMAYAIQAEEEEEPPLASTPTPAHLLPRIAKSHTYNRIYRGEGIGPGSVVFVR